MNKKRAIWIAALLYVATFAIGIATALLLGTDLTGEEPITLMHWVLSIVLSVAVTAAFSHWYFKGKGIALSVKNGWKLGLTFLVVGIFFDALFTIPYAFQNGPDALVAYYSDPLFYVSVALIVATPAAYAKLKAKKSAPTPQPQNNETPQ